MAPINVVLIGLSKSAKTGWASTAHLPYLLSPRGRSKYRIHGLLNSSVAAGEAAIATYGLPASTTKAYASPEDVAADPAVDLVVTITRVDAHYPTIRPAVAAGKAVFVEWPLAENADRAAELAALAREQGQATIIGLQARVAPAVVRLREILQSRELGAVLSSALTGYAAAATRGAISSGLQYFYDRATGGNFCTVMVGHTLDYVHAVLGEFASFHAHTQIQRPDVVVVDAATDTRAARRSDVPDLVAITGTLAPSAYVRAGASLAYHLRYEPPFPGTKPLVWTISCEHGDIEVASERSAFLNSEASVAPISIRVHTFATGEVRTEELRWEDWQEDLPPRGRNIAKLYDLYAEGKLLEATHADFELAARRHQELDSWLVPSS